MTDRAIYLRPSGAATWGRCFGYAAMMAAMGAPPEDTDNEVREDGTACHWLAQEGWHGRWPAVGTMSPNARELTEEMFAGVEEYHSLLRSWVTPPAIEQTLPVASVFRGVQDGTPDAYSVSGIRLDLADLKFGFRPVEVWRCAQLIVYAWTLLMLFPQVTEVVLWIVQPRCPHRDGTTRAWKTTRDELRPLAEKLQAAALAALEPDPMCTVSSACQNCGAAGSCRTLQAAAGAGMDVSYGSTPHTLDAAALGYELSKLQAAAAHIEHRIIGLSAQAESLIRRGQSVPGHKLDNAATRWRWRDDCVEQVQQLGRLLGVEVNAPPKMRTVAQLRNAFPKLDVQAMYAEKPTGERRLMATDPNEALRAFMKRK